MKNQDQLIIDGTPIAKHALRHYQKICQQRNETDKLFAIQVALVSPYPLGEAITKEALHVYEQNLAWQIKTPTLDKLKVKQWQYEYDVIAELFENQLLYTN